MEGWGMGWFNKISIAVFWILILMGLIFVIRWLIQNKKRDSDGTRCNLNKALKILKKHYTRGELNKEEFERIKDDLHFRCC
jgi:putative membrane protein